MRIVTKIFLFITVIYSFHWQINSTNHNMLQLLATPLILTIVSPFEEQDPEVLSGKTLDVYYLLMELKEWIGVREVQRLLGYSSPNLAFYHLNKLYELDLANKSDDNKYVISQKGIEKKLGHYQDRFSVMGNWISDFYLLFITFVILSILNVSFYVLQIPKEIWFYIYAPITICLAYFYWVRARSLDKLPTRINTMEK